MKRTSIKIHTFTILCTVLLTGIEFLLYYFLDMPIAVFLTTVLGSLLLAHAGLEASYTYAQGFLQVLISTVLSAILIVFLYFYQNSPLVHYQNYLPWVLFVNWFCPVAYLCIRSMLDVGPRFVGFRSFFRNASALFAVYYAWFFAITVLSKKEYFGGLIVDLQPNYIPFYHFASHISSYRLGQEHLAPIIDYVRIFLLAFIPAGFFVSLLLRKRKAAFSCSLVLSVSVAAELIRTVLNHPFQMDHVLFGFLGALIGIIFYHIWDYTYCYYTHVHFMDERKSRSFYSNVYYKL